MLVEEHPEPLSAQQLLGAESIGEVAEIAGQLRRGAEVGGEPFHEALHPSRRLLRLGEGRIQEPPEPLLLRLGNVAADPPAREDERQPGPVVPLGGQVHRQRETFGGLLV